MKLWNLMRDTQMFHNVNTSDFTGTRFAWFCQSIAYPRDSVYVGRWRNLA